MQRLRIGILIQIDDVPMTGDVARGTKAGKLLTTASGSCSFLYPDPNNVVFSSRARLTALDKTTEIFQPLLSMLQSKFSSKWLGVRASSKKMVDNIAAGSIARTCILMWKPLQ